MLVVENLKFSYEDNTVLNGIDLTARSGELVGIVGPNGAGKTTLIRAISGVLKPEVGIIKIGDIDLSLLSSSQRAKMISVVPQNPQLPLSFKVIDLVSMGRNPYLGIFEWEGDHDIQIIMRAMDLTDTTHLSQRLVGTLSGGEVQRVLVAMALVQETDIILMDEPESGLDQEAFFAPITRYFARPKSIAEIPEAVTEAFRIILQDEHVKGVLKASHQFGHEGVIECVRRIVRAVVVLVSEICRVGDHQGRKSLVPERCVVTQTGVREDPAVKPNKKGLHR